MKIEENIICSEVHRAFFKSKIGESFSFNVTFQKWLKANSGKYKDIDIMIDYAAGRVMKLGELTPEWWT
ncbi:DUF6434 domain-containing protein [Butyrivibrio sp. NC2002]|uniref:DUF6434 domain-containing protein n=1 Tax=Butyrivibrio sp. NC2002 TaxID=1410610 RepID=UPI002E8DEAEC|nr:DUF6434 domain-containing protein [Butyrivibrio sp. NC2002]